jgi:hypothetical protein
MVKKLIRSGNKDSVFKIQKVLLSGHGLLIGDDLIYFGNGIKCNGYVQKRVNRQTKCGENKSSGVIFCRDGRFCRDVGFCNDGGFCGSSGVDGTGDGMLDVTGRVNDPIKFWIGDVVHKLVINSN